MAAELDLKQIERKAWTSYFQDGLWDIALGVYMLTPAIRTFTDNVWFTLLFLAAPVILIIGKRFITVPRIGRVKFGPARKARQRNVRIAFGVSFLVLNTVLLLVLVVLAPPEAWIRATVLGICLVLLLGLVAYLLDVARLYVYFAVLAAGFVLWELSGDPAGPICLAISGGIVLTIGLALFLRFLHKYPNPNEEALDNNV
jgi:hypothetical protein